MGKTVVTLVVNYAHRNFSTVKEAFYDISLSSDYFYGNQARLPFSEIQNWNLLYWALQTGQSYFFYDFVCINFITFI
jgi:hypothetical protein